MFGSQVMETATGIVFVFLAISLATTAVQELIASFLRLRAKTLRTGLKAMLVRGDQGIALYEKIVTHPTITPAGDTPSYVSAQQFSSALFSVLSVDETPTLASLHASITALPDGPMKPVLASLFREGEDTITKYEARLQQWFDQSMDRVGGIYKRLSQWMSLAIGAAFAFLFQVNAIGIVLMLWGETPLRNAVDKAMTSYLAAPGIGQQSLNALAPTLSQFGFSPIWNGHIDISISWFIGCAITAIAASLGAPFWFDFLQSFVNLRSTGAPPLPATH